MQHFKRKIGYTLNNGGGGRFRVWQENRRIRFPGGRHQTWGGVGSEERHWMASSDQILGSINLTCFIVAVKRSTIETITLFRGFHSHLVQSAFSSSSLHFKLQNSHNSGFSLIPLVVHSQNKTHEISYMFRWTRIWFMYRYLQFCMPVVRKPCFRDI